MDIQPVTIELKTGYTDGEKKTHKTVTFGKPVTGETLFAIDDDPMSALETQKELLIFSRAITKFGTARMPVPLQFLLELDEFDLEDLSKAYDEFSEQGAARGGVEFVSDGEVKLGGGFKKDGLTYNRVAFGKHITGRDMANADREGYRALRRACFLIGRQITAIKSEDGSSHLEGPLGLEFFNELDGADIFTLRIASERWRDSFRRQREGVQGEVGAQRVANSEGDRVVGERDS